MTVAITISTDAPAQLYWDTQCEPEDAGWSLRYRTADGNEHHAEFEGDEEASIEWLASTLRREIGAIELTLLGPWRVEVFARHGHKRGSVTIYPRKGVASTCSRLDWRCA